MAYGFRIAFSGGRKGRETGNRERERSFGIINTALFLSIKPNWVFIQ